nr:mismatch-specific DNA-glycosylase [Phototrophicus methaneseepsis]
MPDLLETGLRLVFCGTAASDISAREGAYYANPANKFWRTLYDIGLIPEPLQPKQFPQLLTYRIGLTDVAKHAQGVDAMLTPSDFDAIALHEKLLLYQPAMVAFTSKKAASVYFAKATGGLQYGIQPEILGETRFWVLPSPSGAAVRYWDIQQWHALSAWVKEHA